MSAVALGFIAALCWGIHDVTVRRISQTAPLMATLLWVLIFGALFQITMMLTSGGFTPLSRSAIVYSIAAGATFLMASAALYGAFFRGPVRLVAPLIGSYPIFSVGLATALGVSISVFQWLAVLAVVGGIALVTVFSDETAEDIPPIGPTILLSLASAFGFFATFALGQHAATLGDAASSILITRLTSVALLLPVILLFSLPLWPGRSAVSFVCTMGVLDGIALLCVLSAGSLPYAEFASVASSVFGVITIVLAWMFLKERMTVLQWIGCAVAFGGIGYLAL